MKRIFSVVFLLSTFFIISCGEDDDSPQINSQSNSENKKNQIIAKVDNDLIVFDLYGRVNVDTSTSTTSISFNAKVPHNNDSTEISISIYFPIDLELGRHSLFYDDSPSIVYKDHRPEGYWQSLFSSFEGFLNMQKYDRSSRKIEGTFECKTGPSSIPLSGSGGQDIIDGKFYIEY